MEFFQRITRHVHVNKLDGGNICSFIYLFNIINEENSHKVVRLGLKYIFLNFGINLPLLNFKIKEDEFQIQLESFTIHLNKTFSFESNMSSLFIVNV